MMNQEWKTLNNEQAEALFAAHAILIGSYDRVPRFVAADLFGIETVKAIQHSNPSYCSMVNYGSDVFYYLTRDGFKACVSYLNCKALQAQSDALHNIEWAAIEAEDAKSNEAAEIALRLHPEMWAMLEKDCKHGYTKEEQAQINAWQDEAMPLVGTAEGAEILKRPAPYMKQTKRRGRPRKTA